MATYTTNLDLIKPAGTDKIRIAQINENMDTLDAAIGAVGNTSLQTQVSGNTAAIANVQNGLAYIVGNTNTTGGTLAVGQFVYVNGHSTISEGLRKVTASISANGSITTSNTDACSEGGLNALNSKLVYKAIHVSPSDTTNKIYDTGVSNNDYFFIGAFTPFDDNIEVRMTNKASGNGGNYRYTLWDTVSNTKITSGYNYWVYCAFLSRNGLQEIT